MSGSTARLVLDLLEWIDHRLRTYIETMDAWRSTCPRLTVWEDAVMNDLVQVASNGPAAGSTVILTPRGRAMLEARECEVA